MGRRILQLAVAAIFSTEASDKTNLKSPFDFSSSLSSPLSIGYPMPMSIWLAK